MLSIFVMSMISLSLLAAVFDIFPDNDDEEIIEEENIQQVEQDDQGELGDEGMSDDQGDQDNQGGPNSDWITIEGGDEVYAGGGDDSLISDSYLDEPVTVYGETGDDTFIIDASNSEFYGGKGDDLLLIDGSGNQIFGREDDDEIVVSGYDNTVYGGLGDDVIGGTVDRHALFGGAGDDVVSIDSPFGYSNEISHAYGGSGDDVLRYDVQITVDDPNIGVVELTGGSGADIFEIKVQTDGGFVQYDPVTADELVLAPGEAFPASGAGAITDFVPGEDTLVIDANFDDPDHPGVELAFDHFEIAEAADGSSTTVRLFMDSSYSGSPVMTTIVLEGVTGMQESDIAFTLLPPIIDTQISA